MKKNVTTLVITGYGLNCQSETTKAFLMAGSKVRMIHLNDILEDGKILDKFHIIAFIGGFSFGDHLGAGTVFANRIKFRMKEDLMNFVSSGRLIIGICNGFQTITRLGLVPALKSKYFVQEVALAHNESGQFRDDWVWLKSESDSPCVFTRNVEKIFLPVRHGEGKFVAEKKTLCEMESKKLVALRYCSPEGRTDVGFPYNPNGSVNNIAGICDETGRIFGLMPHPEAHISPFNSPYWNEEKIKMGITKNTGEGLVIFENAVNYAKEFLK